MFKYFLIRLISVTCIVCFSSHAFANTNWLNTLNSYKEVGNAKFSVFFFDIYKSRLLTPNGVFNFENKPYLFEITYLKDISSSDLIERTIEQWEHLNIDKESYQQYSALLSKLWPNIVASDRLAIQVNDKKSKFYFNNKFIGSINDDRFGDLFLAIWLSPETSQPELRAALLGVNTNE